MRGNNVPINRPLLFEELANLLTHLIETFFVQALNGWLKGWKKRYVQIASLYTLPFKNPQKGKWSTFREISSMIN